MIVLVATSFPFPAIVMRDTDNTVSKASLYEEYCLQAPADTALPALLESAFSIDRPDLCLFCIKEALVTPTRILYALAAGLSEGGVSCKCIPFETSFDLSLEKECLVDSLFSALRLLSLGQKQPQGAS